MSGAGEEAVEPVEPVEPVDPAEVLALVRAVRDRLAWQARGGVVGLPPDPPGAIEAARAKASAPASARASTPTPARAPAPAPAPASEGPPLDGASLIAAALAAIDKKSPPVAAPKPTVAAAPVPAAAAFGAPALRAIQEEIGDCQRCKLSRGRNSIVFGVGNPEAAVVFVGEAPGQEEDLRGEPFVGPAGQLLDRMIVAMGLSRPEVYIANIVKCRPPANRNPEPDEIAACEPFLVKQLGAIRPRMIVCLGKFAAQTLLCKDAPISAMRGRFHQYQGIPLMPTFHPAFLLRNPEAKREVWNDLQLVMKELDRLGIPRRKSP
jgi:DNA polymerase